MLMRENLLQFAVLSEKGKILAIKEYRTKSDMDFAEFFDAVYGQDYFLKEEYAGVEVVNGTLEFSLIPTQYFQPKMVQEFAGALIKDNFDVDHVAFRSVDSAGATAVYTVPFPLKQKCDFYFDAPEFIPFCQPAINMASQLAKNHPDMVLVNIFDKQFVITGMKNGKLHLCNAYDFIGVTDIVYFTQLVLEILKVDANVCKIFVVGEFEEDSELIRQLKKYIGSVQIPVNALMDGFETQSEKLPIWKYAYLTY